MNLGEVNEEEIVSLVEELRNPEALKITEEEAAAFTEFYTYASTWSTVDKAMFESTAKQCEGGECEAFEAVLMDLPIQYDSKHTLYASVNMEEAELHQAEQENQTEETPEENTEETETPSVTEETEQPSK